MSNQDTKVTTEQHIDTHQKPIASFGQGEKAFLIQKDSADPSCILTFPQLLQAKCQNYIPPQVVFLAINPPNSIALAEIERQKIKPITTIVKKLLAVKCESYGGVLTDS